MARPNVTFKVNDQSVVGPGAEQVSFKLVGAMLSVGNHFQKMARTGETAQGFMLVPNISDLYARLNSMIVTIAGGQTFYNAEFPAGATVSAGACAASYLNGTYGGTAFGTTGDNINFKSEFWALNNFLQYGSPCYVGYQTGGLVAISDSVLFDVIFQGISSSAGVTSVYEVVKAKKDNDLPVFGILNTPSATTPIISEPTTNYPDVDGITLDSGDIRFHFATVYGEKVHLGADADTLVTTILAPDAAGCLARTDRDFFPWTSPAGARRGRILNLVKLNRNLRAAEQDYLYDAGVNPVVTFPGEGTFLFGDKTLYPDTSTLSRINVGRLFINLKKTLGALARRTLFEINNESTRAIFKAEAEIILETVKTQNGLTEYKVICDETNNPITAVEANEFYAEVLIKPTTSINFITITLTNVDLEDTIA